MAALRMSWQICDVQLPGLSILHPDVIRGHDPTGIVETADGNVDFICTSGIAVGEGSPAAAAESAQHAGR